MDVRWLATGTAAASALLGGVAAAAEAVPRQVLELRLYRFASESRLEAFGAYAESCLIPALGRAGIGPVGLWRLRRADNPKLGLEADELQVYLLLPHPDLASVLALPEVLDRDPEAVAGAKSSLGRPQSDPLYERYETRLMHAFAACPKVEVPTRSPDRVLQLRIYESHNEDRALRKIEMFSQGGEIALFRRVGLNPVFFGQSLAGTGLPNLTYMVGFENTSAQEAAWDAFRRHPDWAALKDDPRYAETVSRITNLILRPLPGSQI